MKKFIRNTVSTLILFLGLISGAFGQEGSEHFHFSLTTKHDYYNGDSDTKIISLGVFGISDINILGWQASLFYSRAEGNVTGIQESYGINTCGGTVTGVQLSALMNKADFVRGAQITGVYNKAQDVKGAQIAPFCNNALDVTGAQVSYFLNKADTVNGAQVGLINIADENSGCTFGLINIVKNGVHDFGTGIDTNGNLFFQVQEGAPGLYTVIGAAGKIKQDYFNGEYAEAFIGLGNRDTYGIISIDKELLWKFVFCDETQIISDSIEDAYDDDNDDEARELVRELRHFQIPAARITANLECVKHFSLFAAAEVDMKVNYFNSEAFIHKDNNLSGSMTLDGNKITFYPSFSAGIKIR